MNVQSKPTPPPEHLTIDAFFAWAESQERKYELVDGIAQLQAWVKRSHSLIVGNIDFALQSALDRNSYAVHQGDFAIQTGQRSIRYADLLVEPAGASMDARTSDQAILVVEVLSTSTMHVDFGAKRLEYLGLATLDTYLVAAQDQRRIWQWTRGEDGGFPEEPLQIVEGDVSILALGVSLAVDEVYRRVL